MFTKGTTRKYDYQIHASRRSSDQVTQISVGGWVSIYAMITGELIEVE